MNKKESIDIIVNEFDWLDCSVVGDCISLRFNGEEMLVVWLMNSIDNGFFNSYLADVRTDDIKQFKSIESLIDCIWSSEIVVSYWRQKQIDSILD